MKTVQMGPLNTLKRRTTHLALGLGLAATLALGAVMPASADDVTGTSVVTGGSLTYDVTEITAAFPVTKSVLGEDVTSAPVELNVHIADDRGTGAGWKVQIAATTFSDGEVAPKTLPDIGTLAVSAIEVAPEGDGTYTSPTPSVNGARAITTGTSAASIFNAGADSGMGHFLVQPSLTVTVPANAYAETYTSTISITTSTGPQ